MNIEEIWLRMSQVKKLPAQRTVKIVNSLAQLDRINAQALQGCGLNEIQQLQFLHVPMHKIEQVQKWLTEQNNQLITFLDPNYPYLLKQIYHPPLLLFVKGNKELLVTQQIAVIGSRHASEYGRKWTNIFVKEFVQHGITITSGLALGIDGISHKAALDNNGKTIAVLGSGLDNIYPKQHYELAEQIKINGALISEYWPNIPPLPKQFPKRNRIISGLSKAVVVIEAGMKSGSLITARYAIEQNRDLFALPAPLGNSGFCGNHWLLQQGAYLLMEADDVLQHIVGGLNWIQTELPIIEESPSTFNVVENKILGMVGYQATPVDVIAENAQIPVAKVISILTEMEINGVISSNAGGYIRLN